MGSIDHPFNPLALCMGSDATFVARTMDRDPKHLRAMLLRSNEHKGAALLEIYQNCNVFNDGAFFGYTDPSTPTSPEGVLVRAFRWRRVTRSSRPSVSTTSPSRQTPDISVWDDDGHPRIEWEIEEELEEELSSNSRT